MKINFVKHISYNFAKPAHIKHTQNPIALNSDQLCFGARAMNPEKRKAMEDRYVFQQEFHPKTAFIYDPDLSLSKKSEMIKADKSIVPVSVLASDLGLSDINQLNVWIKAGSLAGDEIAGPKGGKFVDVDFAKNKEFIEFLKEKLPSSISTAELSFKYNLPAAKIRDYFENGKLNALGAKYENGLGSLNMTIDLNDEDNAKTLENHLKTTAIPSEKYYKSDELGLSQQIMVPVKYLEQLGFGDARKLASMIKNGQLAGNYEVIDVGHGKKKLRAQVDIGCYVKGEETLKDLREKNDSVIEVNDFAKQLNIRVKDIKEALDSDEFKIIQNYIFNDDKNKLYINLKDEKVHDFIYKVFTEQEILKQIRKEKKQEQKIQRNRKSNNEQSMRAKIAWHLSTNTSKIASELAKGDGYLCSVIEKNADADQELTNRETIKLKSYFKNIWQTAGIQEYRESCKKASAYVKQFKTEGIDSIDDPEIREILEKYL